MLHKIKPGAIVEIAGLFQIEHNGEIHMIKDIVAHWSYNTGPCRTVNYSLVGTDLVLHSDFIRLLPDAAQI